DENRFIASAWPSGADTAAGTDAEGYRAHGRDDTEMPPISGERGDHQPAASAPTDIGAHREPACAVPSRRTWRQARHIDRARAASASATQYRPAIVNVRPR